MAVDAVLALVRERTGLDFTRYRRSTIERRIANRMISVHAGTLADYLALLGSCPGEAARLVERLTIKVSRFYRDAVTFDCLRERVLPELARLRRGTPLSMWCAGCGYGEEAWTLAMLLAEADIPGQVIATDVDEAALARARCARYARGARAALPAALERFFDPGTGANDTLSVAAELRRRVRFERHDVTAPPPGADGGFDLVSCRNLLIYLQRDAQEQAARNLLRALAPGGFLCLGEAEWPPASIVSRLEPLPPRTRLFRRRASEAGAAP